MADSIVESRHPNTPLNPARGETHGRARLTEQDVLQIRRLHTLGIRQAELARLYQVTRATIHLIVHSRRWTHL